MFKKLSKEWYLILFLAMFKLMLHFATNTNYELHRDAFLYLAESDHLDFGFWSEAPMTPLLGKVTLFLFGSSVFSIRLFPALIGAISVILIGLLVRNLGGRMWAISLACGAFILSPAFLRSNTLFQPVSFDQFFWLLTTFFIVKLIQSKDPKYWLHLGVVWGFAFLTKYSIAFLVLPFVVALLLAPERKLFVSKYFLYGLLVGFMTILPNLIWQYNHNFPVILHMVRLRETQLVNVRVSDFIVSQFLMNFPGIIIWVTGLVSLLIQKSTKPFRVLGWTYLGVVLLFILLKGKGYYALGIYPILFIFGGLAIENAFANRFRFLRPATLVVVILLLIPILPYSLPVFKLDQMIEYGQQSRNYGAEGALRWEDGKIHPLPQDYADMTGWKELAGIVIQTWQSLSDSERAECAIFASNYGEAGCIKFYGKKLGIPEPICFDGSFLFWAPDTSRIKTLIYVDDDAENISRYFEKVEKIGQITDPYARESGLPVFLCRQARNSLEGFYTNTVSRLKQEVTCMN